MLDLRPKHIAPEGLALRPVFQVVIDHAPYRNGGQTRRNAADCKAETNHARLVIAAAQHHLVVRQLASIYLSGVSVEPEIGDPVLSTRVRATADLNRKASNGLVLVAPDRL